MVGSLVTGRESGTARTSMFSRRRPPVFLAGLPLPAMSSRMERPGEVELRSARLERGEGILGGPEFARIMLTWVRVIVLGMVLYGRRRDGERRPGASRLRVPCLWGDEPRRGVVPPGRFGVGRHWSDEAGRDSC